jgi:hypothetical protein
MSELRKYLMLMAILAATVTYVAGLNPPATSPATRSWW